MLIRSQDKLSLIELSCINISINRYTTFEYKCHDYYLIQCNIAILGEYSTKEKAIKVLDMIEEEYNTPTYINDEGGGEYAKYNNKIFHMPQDSEVIIWNHY